MPLSMRLADGPALAHVRPVVHGDIKRGNAMLRAPNGALVLVDFGLASAGDGSGPLRPVLDRPTPAEQARSWSERRRARRRRPREGRRRKRGARPPDGQLRL